MYNTWVYLLDKKELLMSQKQGYIMVFIAGLLWGTIGIFSTLLGRMGLTSSETSFYRLFAASVILAISLIIKGKGFKLFKISKRGLISCILIGCVSQAFYNICYMTCVQTAGMSTAAVLLYTSPVFVLIISRIAFKEKITGFKILAIILNIVGCVLTVTGGNLSKLSIATIGIVMGLLAGFTYGLLPVLSRIGADNEDPFTSAFYGLTFGMIVLFFVVRPYHGLSVPFTMPMLLVILGFGLSSAAAYIVYFLGLNVIKETSIVPVLCSIETIAASVFGLIIFHESFNLFKVLGVLLVFCSIIFINIKGAKAKNSNN